MSLVSADTGKIDPAWPKHLGNIKNPELYNITTNFCTELDTNEAKFKGVYRKRKNMCVEHGN